MFSTPESTRNLPGSGSNPLVPGTTHGTSRLLLPQAATPKQQTPAENGFFQQVTGRQKGLNVRSGSSADAINNPDLAGRWEHCAPIAAQGMVRVCDQNPLSHRRSSFRARLGARERSLRTLKCESSITVSGVQLPQWEYVYYTPLPREVPHPHSIPIPNNDSCNHRVNSVLCLYNYSGLGRNSNNLQPVHKYIRGGMTVFSLWGTARGKVSSVSSPLTEDPAKLLGGGKEEGWIQPHPILLQSKQ